jgi:hypothetical protein
MRRWTTPLIVAGVVLVGVLAVSDALRGHGEPKAAPESPTVTRPAPPTLRDMLRREAITGFVVYSDPDCVLHSLLLPRLLDQVVRTETNEPLRLCRFTVAGGRFLEEGQVPSPDGTLLARCRDGLVVVSELETGRQRRSFIGCPPAWRPDGWLTYPRGDRIMQEGRVLYSGRDLEVAGRSHPNVAGLGSDVAVFVHATDLAWLDEDHLVASLGIGVQPNRFEFLAVLFEGDRVIGSTTNFGFLVRNWFVSPSGSFAAAENGTIVTRDGDFTDPPRNLPDGRAVAFSPDEQWLAYVTDTSIYLVGTPRNSEPGRIIRLPIAAQDLVWDPVSRGTAVGPPILR